MRLLQKGVPFIWDDRAQQSFDNNGFHGASLNRDVDSDGFRDVAQVPLCR